MLVLFLPIFSHLKSTPCPSHPLHTRFPPPSPSPSYASRKADSLLLAACKSLQVESASGLALLKPLEATCERRCQAGRTNATVKSTAISLRLPLQSLSLAQRLLADVSAAMTFGGGPLAVRCFKFDRIWFSGAC